MPLETMIRMTSDMSTLSTALKIDGVMGPKTQAGFTAQAGGSAPSVAALKSIRAAAEKKGSLGLFNKAVTK